jgi:TetR/AcrR family transcriptional regulator, repressor for lfrA
VVDVQERGSRARTRQAIIAAAIEVLSGNPSASLGEIATAADVGRTTLHRYFPERSDLLKAITEETYARLNEATLRARLDDGTGAEALGRLCAEYFDLGSLLSLVFTEPNLVDTTAWDQSECGDVAFTALIERGHRDGTIDASLPTSWVQYVLWSQLYAAWSYVNEAGASRHETLRLLERTVVNSVRP